MDNLIKEYALNIFNKKEGYTLEKALKIVPERFPEILYEYTLLESAKYADELKKAISLNKIQSLRVANFIKITNTFKNYIFAIQEQSKLEGAAYFNEYGSTIITTSRKLINLYKAWNAEIKPFINIDKQANFFNLMLPL